MMRDISNQFRRVYTDGRDWPATLPHSANGYSIGKWLDQDGYGRYDTLAIETRGLKNPHSYDSSGMPFHDDNAAVIKERLFIDKADPEVMLNEVTVIDHALTRPWTVTRSYRHVRDPQWLEYVCAEDNHHVVIGKEEYLVSQDGFLMPTRKDQSSASLAGFRSAAAVAGFLQWDRCSCRRREGRTAFHSFSPHAIRAFTPVFDGLWRRGDEGPLPRV